MVLRYGNVFINTMEHGLKYFNLGTLKKGTKKVEDKEVPDETKLICEDTDLKEVNKDSAEGHIVTALFSDRRDNSLIVLS